MKSRISLNLKIALVGLTIEGIVILVVLYIAGYL